MDHPPRLDVGRRIDIAAPNSIDHQLYRATAREGKSSGVASFDCSLRSRSG
jgi:hypothetical protein